MSIKTVARVRDSSYPISVSENCISVSKENDTQCVYSFGQVFVDSSKRIVSDSLDSKKSFANKSIDSVLFDRHIAASIPKLFQGHSLAVILCGSSPNSLDMDPFWGQPTCFVYKNQFLNSGYFENDQSSANNVSEYMNSKVNTNRSVEKVSNANRNGTYVYNSYYSQGLIYQACRSLFILLDSAMSKTKISNSLDDQNLVSKASLAGSKLKQPTFFSVPTKPQIDLTPCSISISYYTFSKSNDSLQDLLNNSASIPVTTLLNTSGTGLDSRLTETKIDSYLQFVRFLANISNKLYGKLEESRPTVLSIKVSLIHSDPNPGYLTFLNTRGCSQQERDELSRIIAQVTESQNRQDRYTFEKHITSSLKSKVLSSSTNFSKPVKFQNDTHIPKNIRFGSTTDSYKKDKRHQSSSSVLLVACITTETKPRVDLQNEISDSNQKTCRTDFNNEPVQNTACYQNALDALEFAHVSCPSKCKKTTHLMSLPSMNLQNGDNENKKRLDYNGPKNPPMLPSINPRNHQLYKSVNHIGSYNLDKSEKATLPFFSMAADVDSDTNHSNRSLNTVNILPAFRHNRHAAQDSLSSMSSFSSVPGSANTSFITTNTCNTSVLDAPNHYQKILSPLSSPAPNNFPFNYRPDKESQLLSFAPGSVDLPTPIKTLELASPVSLSIDSLKSSLPNSFSSPKILPALGSIENVLDLEVGFENSLSQFFGNHPNKNASETLQDHDSAQIESLQIDLKADEIKAMKKTIDSQADSISEFKAKINELVLENAKYRQQIDDQKEMCKELEKKCLQKKETDTNHYENITKCYQNSSDSFKEFCDGLEGSKLSFCNNFLFSLASDFQTDLLKGSDKYQIGIRPNSKYFDDFDLEENDTDSSNHHASQLARKLKSTESSLASVEVELQALRSAQKQHDIESQFLTRRYNKARLEADTQKKESERLKNILKQLILEEKGMIGFKTLNIENEERFKEQNGILTLGEELKKSLCRVSSTKSWETFGTESSMEEEGHCGLDKHDQDIEYKKVEGYHPAYRNSLKSICGDSLYDLDKYIEGLKRLSSQSFELFKNQNVRNRTSLMSTSSDYRSPYFFDDISVSGSRSSSQFEGNNEYNKYRLSEPTDRGDRKDRLSLGQDFDKECEKDTSCFNSVKSSIIIPTESNILGKVSDSENNKSGSISPRSPPKIGLSPAKLFSGRSNSSEDVLTSTQNINPSSKGSLSNDEKSKDDDLSDNRMTFGDKQSKKQKSSLFTVFNHRKFGPKR